MSNIETRQEAFLKALSSAGISLEYQGDGVFTGQSRLVEMVFDAACNWQARAQNGGEPECLNEIHAAFDSVKRRIEGSHTAKAPTANDAVNRVFEAMRLEIESRTPMFSQQTSAVVPETPHVYGKDCPEGMVQVEFVGCSPSLKQGEYGWFPTKSAFLEVYVDGVRYRIDVGTKDKGKGPVRGLHIIGSTLMQVDQHSINAVSIYQEACKTAPPEQEQES